MDTRAKVVNAEQVSELLARNSSNGNRLVVARGWFDVLRASHCRLLAEAKGQGGRLVVLLHTDSDEHPTILEQSARAQLVAAVAAVDAVVLCDAAQSEQLIASWAPAAIVEEPAGSNLVNDVLERYRPA